MKSKYKPNEGMYDAWQDDPSNWKLGIFYYNKLDRRILPPKRIRGLGWTVNFAHPFSYLTMLGLIIIFVVIGLYIH